MADLRSRPTYISRSLGNIGVSPHSSHVETLRSNNVFLRNHLGHNQVFTYSGPGPGTYDSYNPDFDYYDTNGVHAEFPIILHSPPKTDSSFPSRQLAGVLLPWRTVPRYYEGEYCDYPAKISWKHLHDGETVYRELYRSESCWPDNWADIDRFTRIDPSGKIELWDHRTPGSIFVDHNGECTGLSGLWVAGNSATITKDTTETYNDHPSIKVARNGTNNPYVEGPYSNYTKQMTEGADYYISVWCKSDGNATPVVKCGSDTLATGTTSTSWQHLTASFVADADVMKFEATTSTGTEACYFANFILEETGQFRYQPDASGEFTVGILRVERIKVAALSVFTAPDYVLTDAQAVVTSGNVAEGRAIRGYTGTGVGSIGDLLYMTAKGGSTYTADDCERNTRRCLLQSGHPMGLSTDQSSAYYNVRSDEASYFRVTPRNLTGKTSGNVSTIPMLYGYCSGASGGNPGYVKYTALTSTDTWEYEITSDTAGLWGDMTTLDVDADVDYVKIEFKAPSGGWLVCPSFSLWEDSYDS